MTEYNEVGEVVLRNAMDARLEQQGIRLARIAASEHPITRWTAGPGGTYVTRDDDGAAHVWREVSIPMWEDTPDSEREIIALYRKGVRAGVAYVKEVK